MSSVCSRLTYFGDVGGGRGAGGFRCDRLCAHKHARLQISAGIDLGRRGTDTALEYLR